MIRLHKCHALSARCANCGVVTSSAAAEGWYVSIAEKSHYGTDYHCPFCADALVAMGKAAMLSSQIATMVVDITRDESPED